MSCARLDFNRAESLFLNIIALTHTKTVRKAIKENTRGRFNVNNMELLQAIIEGFAKSEKATVMLQISKGRAIRQPGLS